MAVYDRKDTFYKKAKAEGYKSRAAYKLIELDKRFKLMRRGDKILDCGAAPGGWSQVALELIGDNGKVVGVDLDEITGIPNKNFISIAGDFTLEETLNAVLAVSSDYNTVISDIAPHTTGVKDADHFNSIELVRHVHVFMKKVLKPGGSFVCKMFEGVERQQLVKDIKADFKNIKIVHPEASRSGSVEIYVVATGYIKSGGTDK